MSHPAINAANPVNDLLLHRFRDAPDATYALFSDGSEQSVGAIATGAWRCARFLLTSGISVGDCVVSWQPNGPSSLRDYFGTLCAGGIFTPLNVSYRGPILEHVWQVASARVAFVHTGLLARLATIDLGPTRLIIAVGDGSYPDHIGGAKVVHESVLDDIDDTPLSESPELKPADLMAMVFTSGTTGPSKGVLQSYGYYEELSKNYIGEVGPKNRYYLNLPPFHQGALVAQYAMMQSGGSIFVRDAFKAGEYWADVRRHGITDALLIGGMANLLLKADAHPANADNPLQTVCVVPLIPQFREFGSRFSVAVSTCYGMTEIGTPFSSAAPEDARSCGKLNPGYEVRLVDQNGLDVPAGTPGELVVRHFNPLALNSGYRGMPEATAAAWRDGWFHTGDSFQQLATGEYVFVDRMKDTIRRRGENISSAEIEQVVILHPAVEEAAAIGVPSEVVEDEVLIVVTARPDHEIDPEDLIRFLASRLPHYMIPRHVRVVERLPKTPTNKIRKNELRSGDWAKYAWDREAHGISFKREVL